MAQINELIFSIKKLLPDAKVKIDDMSGGGDHFQVDVISSAFQGLSRIQQHQLVYKALQKELASEEIHALALNTSTPD